jgi:hypothetical protein
MEIILVPCGFIALFICAFLMTKLEDYLNRDEHKDLYPLTKQEEIQIKRQRNLDKIIK